MIILSIKTDQPESHFALFDDQKLLTEVNYLAHRDLAQTIHKKILLLLEEQNLNWEDIQGIICFKGPGSFTGLRIGISVANALAYAYTIPIVSEEGVDWQRKGFEKLIEGQNEKMVIPFYGSEPHVTKPRK